MRLYYYPTSANSRRVLLTAILLDARLDLVIVDLLAGEHRGAAYLKINPNGKVPVLEHAEFHLWESHAIMQYLADLDAGQTVYPKDAQPRADVNRWLFWSAYHFTPAVDSSAGSESRRKWLAAQADPTPLRLREARRCSPGRRRCSTGISLIGNGSHRTGLRWPILRSPHRLCTPKPHNSRSASTSICKDGSHRYAPWTRGNAPNRA